MDPLLASPLLAFLVGLALIAVGLVLDLADLLVEKIRRA